MTASRPRETIFLLAQLAAQATGATGFEVIEKKSPEPASQSTILYPICVRGRQVAILAFAFGEAPIPDEKRLLLNQMAAAIEAVQALNEASTRVAVRIASLDAELAHIKIGERTRGLLSGGVEPAEAVHAVIRHVEKVLEHRHLRAIFDQLLPDLEDRVAERKLMMRAKAMLQEQHGMSEEQAYMHLRLRSRSTRKRLRDVSEELISESAPPIRRRSSLQGRSNRLATAAHEAFGANWESIRTSRPAHFSSGNSDEVHPAK